MSDLHLLRPLWLLALLPLALLLWRLWRGRQGGTAWQRVVDAHLLPHVLTGGDGARGPLLLLAAGWLVAVLALAGPSWQRAPAVVFRTEVPPLVLVVDLSRSMTATDVAPSRLERARMRLVELLDRLPPRPVGLVAYGGSAHVVLPPAEDRRIVVQALAALLPDLPPVPGSAPSAGLAEARVLVNRGQHRQADVLLVADGADAALEGAAAELARAGLRVSVLAVGTAAGSIPVAGHTVPVPLDETGLRAAARAGGGGFLGWDEAAAAMAEALSAGRPAPLEAKDSAVTPVVWRDAGRWLALLLLPLAALGFRRGWLGVALLAGLALPQPAEAFDWRDLWTRSDQRAARLLRQGRAPPAEAFTDPQWQGAAHYRAGDYEAAAAAFARAATADAHYNRGNALAQLGRLSDARDAYRTALSLQPGHGDARYNLGLLEKAEQEDDAARRPPAPTRDMRPPPETPQAGGPPPERAAGRGGSGGGDDLAPQPGDMPETHGASRQGEGQREKGTGGGGEADWAAGDMAAVKTSREKGTGGGGEAEDRPGQPEGERSGSATAELPSPRQESSRPRGGEGASAQADAATDAPAGEPRGGGSGEVPPGSPEPEKEEASLPPADGDQGPPGPDTPGRTGAPGGTPKDDAEYQQALEQWLERVPDDASAFLRELFRRQHDRSRSRPVEGPPW